MRVHVNVRFDPSTGKRPRPGSTVRVELRDAGLADAPSRLVSAGEAPLREGDTTTVELNVDESALPAKARLQLSARAAQEQTVPRAPGDWITMESFPWKVGDDSAQVRLRPIA